MTGPWERAVTRCVARLTAVYMRRLHRSARGSAPIALLRPLWWAIILSWEHLWHDYAAHSCVVTQQSFFETAQTGIGELLCLMFQRTLGLAKVDDSRSPGNGPSMQTSPLSWYFLGLERSVPAPSPAAASSRPPPSCVGTVNPPIPAPARREAAYINSSRGGGAQSPARARRTLKTGYRGPRGPTTRTDYRTGS